MTFLALGTTADVVVTDPDELATATDLLRAEVAAIDLACSRFRPDSEISRLHEAAGRPVHVSPLLAEALAAALRAARLTDGLVDPTVGAAVCAMGYDRDFALMPKDVSANAPSAAPGWHHVRLHSTTVVLPRGVQLDLGATAKALAADRAAHAIARHTGCGVLVNLGGDISVAGKAPAGGWQIAIDDATVTLWDGGLASSGTTRRRWLRGGRPVHHIVDPHTGDVPIPCWRTVSVAAQSCVDANIASTAAVVLGSRALDWLAALGLPARLVAEDGTVRTVSGWPSEQAA
jgi:thiamine biosynthesis lipoprotein